MGKHFRNRGEELADDVTSPLAFAVAERDRATIAMVRDALDQRNVMLAYQPVMQTRRPDRPAFYEGLIRVLDDSGRVIPAKDFIETVETSELGRKLDCASLSLGLKALQQDPSLRLSINMSARSISYPNWSRTLRHGLKGDPSLGERLILEITESSAMLIPDTVSVFMADLQGQGISFALDDFGAGNTAFRYFKDFYFDILKIHGQFIRNIHADPDNQVLTAAMLSIARHFEMFAVAEMVENAPDAQYLTNMGMDCLQGYYFGAPTTMAPWKMPAARKSA